MENETRHRRQQQQQQRELGKENGIEEKKWTRAIRRDRGGLRTRFDSFKSANIL